MPLSLMNIVSRHLQFFISIKPANAKHGGQFRVRFFCGGLKARHQMLAGTLLIKNNIWKGSWEESRVLLDYRGILARK